MSREDSYSLFNGAMRRQSVGMSTIGAIQMMVGYGLTS